MKVVKRLLLVGLGTVSVTAPISRPARWQATADLTLGDDRGPDYSFSFVRAMSVGPAGQITVRHFQDRAVDVYDANGARVRRIGRRGKGPGEFESVSGVDWIGNELFIRDDKLRRVTVFDTAGKVLRTQPLPQLTTKADAWVSSWQAMANGLWVAERTERRAGGEIGDVVILDSTGRIVKAVDMLIDGPTDIPIAGPVSMGYQPFEDRSLWRAHPGGDGFTIVDRKALKGRAKFRVRSYGPSGEVRFDRSYSHNPLPITRREADSVADVADYRWRNEAIGPGIAAVPIGPKTVPTSVFRSGLYVPAYHPAVTAIAAGRDGTTWLRREDNGSAEVLWQALNSRGDVVGEVVLPANLEISDADAEHIWGVRTLELDLQEVVRYRIRRR